MKTTKTKEYKDSFIYNDIAEYYLNNARKLVLSETIHLNNIYISVRHYIKTQDHQGSLWIPTQKGIFIKLDQMQTMWNDLKKDIDDLMNKHGNNQSKVA